MIYQGFNSTLLLLHPFSTLFETENEYKVLFQHDWNRIDAPINLFQSRIYFNSSLPQNIYLLIHTTNQALRENQSNFSLFYATIRPVSKIRYRLKGPLQFGFYTHGSVGKTQHQPQQSRMEFTKNSNQQVHFLLVAKMMLYIVVTAFGHTIRYTCA